MTSASPPGGGERRGMAKPLGEALRRARERRGLTAVEVAEAIRSAPHSVASWEVGIAVPRLDSLGRLATVLGLGLGDLNGLFAVGAPQAGRYRRFGQALRSARGRKRQSVAGVARAVGVSAAAVERWQAGRGIPQTWWLPRLARALGWHLGELDAILGAPAVPPEAAGEPTTDPEPEPQRPMALALGALLRSRREQRGWSRRWVGQRAGVGESNLVGYERGEKLPGSEILGRLAYVLELDLGDFTAVLSPWSAARRRWEHLGSALRLARERRGWSWEELAGEAGVRVDVVGRWEEAPPKAPRMASLGPIVEALGLGLGELESAFEPGLPRSRRFERLGPALGMIRASRGLDRSELAGRLGIAPNVVGQWEGGAVPNLGNFARVATLLELELGDLDAALDEAVARSRSARLQGAGPAMWEHARGLLGDRAAVPLEVETRTAVVLAAVRELAHSALAPPEAAPPGGDLSKTDEEDENASRQAENDGRDEAPAVGPAARAHPTDG